MNLTVSALVSRKSVLEEDQLQIAFKVANEIISLDLDKHQLLHFVENQMRLICPNLTQLVGV